MQKQPAVLHAHFPNLLKVTHRLLTRMFFLILITLIPGCSKAHDRTGFSRTINPASGIEEIHLDLLNAEFDLQGTPSHAITFEGWSTDPGIEFIVEEREGSIRIRIHQPDSGTLVHLELNVPDGSYLLVTQAKGAARLSHYNGSISLKSESADISADHLSGVVSLATRRGGIQLSMSEGDLQAIAEADDIQLIDLRGQVSASNIIGGINFNGGIGEGDALRFETDHGDVVVNLSPGSSARIQLTSAGGRIVCSLPGLSGMFDRCSGLLGDGEGSLTIRTVSGAIILNTKP